MGNVVGGYINVQVDWEKFFEKRSIKFEKCVSGSDLVIKYI
jgi:hypothetical protein